MKGRTTSESFSTIRAEIQFENGMLSSRLSAYLTSQSFLMIAFAGSIGVGWSSPGIFLLLVPIPLCVLGLVLSFDALQMIRSSYRVIAGWDRRQTACLEADPDAFSIWLETNPAEGRERVPPAGRDFRQSSGFTRHSPWVFALAWFYFAGATLFLYAAYT